MNKGSSEQLTLISVNYQKEITEFRDWINRASGNFITYSDNDCMILNEYVSVSRSSIHNLIYLLSLSGDITYRLRAKDYNDIITKYFFLLISFHYYNKDRNIRLHSKLDEYFLNFLKWLYDSKLITNDNVEELITLCFKVSTYSNNEGKNIKQIHLLLFGINLFITVVKKCRDNSIITSIETIFTCLNTIISSNKANRMILNRRDELLGLLQLDDAILNSSALSQAMMNILITTYSYYYTDVVFRVLIQNIKKSLININTQSPQEIHSDIRCLNNQIVLISQMISEEAKKELNPQISCGYVFNDSKTTGLMITDINLTLKENTILFSFCQHAQINGQKATLFNINSKSSKEMTFYIFNSCLYIESSKMKEKSTFPIELNTTYFVYISISIGLFSSSIRIMINENIEDIKTTLKKFEGNSLELGCSVEGSENKSKNDLTSTNRFIGVIGPLLFYNCIFDNKKAKIIYSNYKHYDKLALNRKYNLKNMSNKQNDKDRKIYEPFDIYIDNLCLFIHPSTVLNSFKLKIKYCDNYKYISNKKDLYMYGIKYNFKSYPIPENHGTYPFIKTPTISQFIKYDGIDLIILNIEYYYTLVRSFEDTGNTGMISNIFKSIEDLLELNYKIVDYACNIKDERTLDMQMKLFFSFSKFINIVSRHCKPTNQLIDIIHKYTEINHITYELRINIFNFLLDPQLLDSTNRSSFINLFKSVMQLMQEATPNNNSWTNSLISKIFKFNNILNDILDKDIIDEYNNLLIVLISTSNLPQIIRMLSLLCNRDEDITIIEKVLELIYCNYQGNNTFNNEKGKMMIVDQCLILWNFVKKKYYDNNLDLIEAIIIRLIFEQGSITRFINHKSDDNIMNSSIDKTNPACLSNRDNEKTVLSNFSCSTSVLKSLLMEFYDSTSSKSKLTKIKDQSLEHESFTCKIFFLKPFKFETKDYFVLLVKYIMSIPPTNQRLFEYASKFLINILLQLINLFNVTSGKNTFVKCSFDHIFQSYQICYSLFDSCIRRSDTSSNEFTQEVKQNLKTITQTLIHWHPKPFLYKLYNQLISISKEDKCDYLEHFNFNIDIKHNDINILCYENNIKEYTSMMRNLVDYKSLPINFKSEFMTFIQAIKSNGKIYLPEKIQYAKEAKKMTLLELIIEILYKLSNKDSDLISEFIWETKECLHTIVYTFDIKNVNTTKGKHQPDVENKCLTSVIYSKYQDNDSLNIITNPKILQKLIKEINELRSTEKFRKEDFLIKKREGKSILNKNKNTTPNLQISTINSDIGEIKDDPHFSIESDNNEIQKNSFILQCSDNDGLNNYCFNRISNITPKDKITKKDEKNNQVKRDMIVTTSSEEESTIKYDGFCDISIPDAVLCCKRDLLLSKFSLHFLDIYFADEQFHKVKNLYKTEILKNINKERTIYSQSVELTYPTKMKNYSSCSNFQPRIFLKKDLNFYTCPLIKISHGYYNNIPSKKVIKTYHTLIVDKSSEPFDSKYFDKTIKLFELRAQLIKTEYITEGSIYLESKYLLFHSTKEDKSYLNNDDIDNCFCYNKCDIIQRDKELIIVLDQVEEVLIRRFLYMYQAIEVFMKNGKSYYFNLYQIDSVLSTNDSNKKGIFNHLKELKMKYKYSYTLVDNPKEEVTKLNLINNWKENKLTTHDLILLLNKFSGRSYNDLSQYPIMPWVILFPDDIKTKDASNSNTITSRKSSSIYSRSKVVNSSKLDIKEGLENKRISNKDNIKNSKIEAKDKIPHSISEQYLMRNYFYPISIQGEAIKDIIKKKYEYQKKEGIKFCCHFQLFYSTSGYITYYLFRMNPFSNAQIILQSGKFDNPSRQFNSFQRLISILSSNYDSRELIPDLFGSFEYCYNLNYNNFGQRADKLYIHNLELPPNVLNPAQFVFLKKKMLNTDENKKWINQWIDNIFGFHQRQENTLRLNLFNKECYSQLVDLNNKKALYLKKKMSNREIVLKLRRKADCILSFGQAPEQLFNKEIDRWTKIDNSSYEKDVNEDLANLFENANISSRDNINPSNTIIYISMTSKNKFVYILMRDSRFSHLFDLKIYRNIRDISNPNDILIAKMKLFKIAYDDKFLLRYQPKYSIFDTHDGEYFFTCRHYDNSIKIYNKDGEISSYFTDSFILSISRISDEEFLSGSRDGKLVHWNIIYITIGKESTVKIEKKREIFAHHQMISSINYIKKHNIIITTGDDHLLLIRKYHTFELLTKISTNNDLEFFTDCVFSNYNLIYTMTLDTNLLRKPKNKCFFITGYSLNGISFSKTKPDKFNGLCVNDNGILIAGIYDPPSIGLFSLEWDKYQYINNSDIQIQFEKVPFKDNFPWPTINEIKKNRLFTNFLYLDEENTFYAVLTNKIGRFSCNKQQAKTNIYFYNKI